MAQGDLGFTHQATKKGVVFIHHHGRLATTLRGKAADRFLQDMVARDLNGQQQLMARVTGHYKHGNERQGKNRRKA